MGMVTWRAVMVGRTVTGVATETGVAPETVAAAGRREILTSVSRR